jgi:DNA-binding transcriptional LysR family regulator
VELIRTGAVDAAVVRLPIDRTGLHSIPLYTETTVAVVPKDHVVTATEEATVADLADEIVLRPQDDTLPGPVTAGAGSGDRPRDDGRGDRARRRGRRPAGRPPVAGPPPPPPRPHLPTAGRRAGSGVGLAWPDTENTELMERVHRDRPRAHGNSSRTPRPGRDPGTEHSRPCEEERRPPPACPARHAIVVGGFIRRLRGLPAVGVRELMESSTPLLPIATNMS